MGWGGVSVQKWPISKAHVEVAGYGKTPKEERDAYQTAFDVVAEATGSKKKRVTKTRSRPYEEKPGNSTCVGASPKKGSISALSVLVFLRISCRMSPAT